MSRISVHHKNVWENKFTNFQYKIYRTLWPANYNWKPMGTCNTAAQVHSIAQVCQLRYHTCTCRTHDLKPAGFPVPVPNPRCLVCNHNIGGSTRNFDKHETSKPHLNNLARATREKPPQPITNFFSHLKPTPPTLHMGPQPIVHPQLKTCNRPIIWHRYSVRLRVKG